MLSAMTSRDRPTSSPPCGDDGTFVPACALTRRGFVGGSATAVTTILVGCGPSAMRPKPVPAVKDNVVEIDVSKIPELATPGGMIAAQPAGMRKPLIVMRLEDARFRVLSSRCPHLGCTVRWDNEAQSLKCPCHGSRFSDDGKVTKGPAKTSLREYPNQFTGNHLQIAVRDD